MEDNKLKNIIVIKDLPSNIVEEAIVVLKKNKIKQYKKDKEDLKKINTKLRNKRLYFKRS